MKVILAIIVLVLGTTTLSGTNVTTVSKGNVALLCLAYTYNYLFCYIDISFDFVQHLQERPMQQSAIQGVQKHLKR